MKGREMKNKRSLLFVLCGMLLIPLFSADTQVLAAKKGRPGHEAVVVKDKEPKNDEKSGEKPEETSGEKSDKEPKENQEEMTSTIKQDKSAADKAENKEKKKKKKNKKKKNKKKSKGRNKKNRLKKNKKKKTKKGSKKGSKNKAKKGKKGNKNQNNKKSKKGNKNQKKDDKKVNEKKNLDLKEEEVDKIPETDEYKPEINTGIDLGNAGVVNENTGRKSSSSNEESKENLIRVYTVFSEYTDVDGKLRFKSGNAITLPESGYVGFVATGENTGIEDKLTWEGKDLESIKKGIKGNYVLTCITSENVVIGGKDYGKLKFLVYIIVE